MLNNILNLLQNRKSVRVYNNKHIDKGTILSCLEAARLSPSACNKQPWEFIVMKNNKSTIGKLFVGKFYPNKFAEKAPIVIAVIANPDEKTSRMAEYIHGEKYYLVDIGIACSNLILRAWELGLGSCIIGWFDKDLAHHLLQLPKRKQVIALITLGYFDRRISSKRKCRKSIKEVVRFD